MTKNLYKCARCRKRLGDDFVWLELNLVTNQFQLPGTVLPADSQGLFRFGPTCAKRLLKENHERATRTRYV